MVEQMGQKAKVKEQRSLKAVSPKQKETKIIWVTRIYDDIERFYLLVGEEVVMDTLTNNQEFPPWCSGNESD